jgi:hypothetical protein
MPLAQGCMNQMAGMTPTETFNRRPAQGWLAGQHVVMCLCVAGCGFIPSSKVGQLHAPPAQLPAPRRLDACRGPDPDVEPVPVQDHAPPGLKLQRGILSVRGETRACALHASRRTCEPRGGGHTNSCAVQTTNHHKGTTSSCDRALDYAFQRQQPAAAPCSTLAWGRVCVGASPATWQSRPVPECPATGPG